MEPLQVLIVEDIDAMRSQLIELVKSCPGVGRVQGAATTWEARLELDRRRPDLVFLDEILPGELGVDLIPELSGLGIPVLLLTGMADAPLVAEQGLPNGALFRLKKPAWASWEDDRQRFARAMSRAVRR